MKRKRLISLARDFIKEILSHEPYFQAVNNQNGWDLIILGGSSVRGFNDQISDLDLFLVTSVVCQNEFNLLPVNNYKHQNIDFDVSMIATEKIIRDMDNKTHYNWWADSIVLHHRNKQLRQNFLEAASLSQPEFLEIIWTNFVVYEINTMKIDQSLKREDLVSAYACFNENIESLITTALADKGVYCHNKWYGRNLRKIDSGLYNKIFACYGSNFSEIKLKNQQLREYFVSILKKAGFSDAEVGSCEKCNLDKLLFQRL